LGQKRPFFDEIFWRKYLKNHNIGPWKVLGQKIRPVLGLQVVDRGQSFILLDGQVLKRFSQKTQKYFDCCTRVARFFLAQIPKREKIYQITANYTKCP
jgi:hypothetical protein